MIIRCAALILLTSLGVLAGASGSRDTAAQTYPLLHAIPPPPGGPQTGAQFGLSVAVDGDFTVVGAPLDDLGGTASGVVKVFNSTTGALLFLLSHPTPQKNDSFGRSVAISGSLVVVGAWQDSTSVTTAGSAYVYDLASATPTTALTILSNPAPTAAGTFGISVAISGNRVVVGAAGDDQGAPDAGTAYVFDIGSGTPGTPIAVLNNPGPGFGDNFGFSVGISGTRVVVGALFDDTGASLSGSAYVYDLAGGTPTSPVLTLNNPDPARLDSFGGSVAISGTLVAVGASGDDTGATNAGSVYIYDLNAGSPSAPVVTLHNPSPVGGWFGRSVAMGGARIAVGASGNDTVTANSGDAYVYDLSTGTPTSPVAALNNPSPAEDDQFGVSVAISGMRVVVGAPMDDMAATDAGSAFAYDLGSATPASPVAMMNNPGLAERDQFGTSLAISGSRLVVGAPMDDTGTTDAGSAYVYDLGGGAPTSPAFTLNNPSPAASDFFGRSVATSGTLVVVGAHQDDTGATDAGRAYVYELSGATPTTPVAILNNPFPGVFDWFGEAVAISSHYVVVGASRDDTIASEAGSVYVYDLSGGTLTSPLIVLNNPGPSAGDRFGTTVALSGTYLAVGASSTNVGGAAYAGMVHVYDLASATPTVPLISLNSPTPSWGDRFGNSVAMSGTRLVVGESGKGADVGGAYVYDLGSATPSDPVAVLDNLMPGEGDFFGSSVSISGNRVVVGAFEDETGAAGGAAYIYDVGSGTPTVLVATLNNPGPARDDRFGYSVAIEGDTVAIGAPLDDSVLPDKGFAYVFAPPEIVVSGNGVDVADGDSTPSPGDHTEFGGVDVTGTALIRTFTISNAGLTPLILSAVTISGTHAADFAVSAQPASSVAPGASTTFQVTFDPRAHGLRVATLSFVNNDIDESPFDFVIEGTGTGAGTAPARLFVAVSGSDSNICSIQTTPCRNVAFAISQVATDGEVIILSPGEYETAPLLIGKGVKITSPSGTVAFIRQPIIVNAPGARVALRGLTLKGNAASSGITLTAADSLSIEDTTVDGWGVGLDIANAVPSTVAITKTVFQGNLTGGRDVGPASNRVSILGSRFEGNGTGLIASGGTHTVSECSFAANVVALSVSSGVAEISQTQLWINGTGLAVQSGATARIGRSHVFGNTTGLSAAAGSTLASFGSNVIRGNGTNVDGTVTILPEQ